MLFIIFVILTPIIVSEAESEAPIEVCAMCQNEFPVTELLEKEVGGYGRVYCFCGPCIENLYNEYQNKTDIITGE